MMQALFKSQFLKIMSKNAKVKVSLFKTSYGMLPFSSVCMPIKVGETSKG